MFLKNYTIGYTNGGKERKAEISFTKTGLEVKITEGEDVNFHDHCLLSTITALYISSHIRGIIPDTRSLGRLGITLYTELVGGPYKNLKSIEEMTEQEFNDYLKENGL